MITFTAFPFPVKAYEDDPLKEITDTGYIDVITISDLKKVGPITETKDVYTYDALSPTKSVRFRFIYDTTKVLEEGFQLSFDSIWNFWFALWIRPEDNGVKAIFSYQNENKPDGKFYDVKSGSIEKSVIEIGRIYDKETQKYELYYQLNGKKLCSFETDVYKPEVIANTKNTYIAPTNRIYVTKGYIGEYLKSDETLEKDPERNRNLPLHAKQGEYIGLSANSYKEDRTKLAFTSKVDTKLYELIGDNINEIGTLIIPSKDLYTDGSNLRPDGSVSDKAIKKEYNLKDNKFPDTFTALLPVNDNDITTEYTAVSYISYTDIYGNKRVVYSDFKTVSLYKCRMSNNAEAKVADIQCIDYENKYIEQKTGKEVIYKPGKICTFTVEGEHDFTSFVYSYNKTGKWIKTTPY